MSTLIDEASNDDIDPLTRLAIKHGTDKWGPHFYTPIYHELFSHMRDKPIRLLEIGVGGYSFTKIGGASLSMWADYFPKGQILGIDVIEKKLTLDPRIQVRQGSQDDPVFLARMSEEHGPFDIVIDDGSHVPKHVMASFNMLFPKLADSGLYVIEDVQTCFLPQFGGSVLDGGATMDLAKMILEHVNHVEIMIVQPKRQVADFVKSIRSFRAYHNIFVIEKGDNTEPSNFDYRLENIHAARALRTILHELERSPTAAGYANLIDLYRVARKLPEAWAATNEALARWPEHSGLLNAALNVAVQSGDTERKLDFLRRLAALDTDDAALQSLVQKVEAETASTAPSS
jgi:demethylmacrocin O-methyltransferase